jgi:hypothetical protein
LQYSPMRISHNLKFIDYRDCLCLGRASLEVMSSLYQPLS